MQTEAENGEGYKNSSVLTHVREIQGKLLIVHGLLDENVLFKNSVYLIDALVANNVWYDLLLFPNERHGIRKFESRKYLEHRIIHYFDVNL